MCKEREPKKLVNGNLIVSSVHATSLPTKRGGQMNRKAQDGFILVHALEP